MNTQEIYETIEAYLAGEMTDTELQAFEAQMNADAELAKEVQLHADIAVTLQTQDKLKQKQHWQQLLSSQVLNPKQEQSEPTLLGKKNNWGGMTTYLLRIAAMLVLVVGAYFMWQQFSAPDIEKLAWQQWQETETTQQWSGIRGTSTDDTDSEKASFKKSLQLYGDKQFEEALKGLDAVSTQSSLFPDVVLLQSMCLLQLQRNEEAIGKLTFLLQPQNDNLLKDQARWYLALAYLQNDQTTLARQELSKIVNEQSVHWDRASELLKKLDSSK